MVRSEKFEPNHALVRELSRVFHQLTVEVRNRPAITALRLLAVVNVGFKSARIVRETGRRASRAVYRRGL